MQLDLHCAQLDRSNGADEVALTYKDQDTTGPASYLLVLPSLHPSSRRDAVATQAFLAELMSQPSQASAM